MAMRLPRVPAPVRARPAPLATPRATRLATPLAVLLVALLASGCTVARNAGSAGVAAPPTVTSPGGRFPDGPGREPRTLAGAVRLARAEADRFTAGDYAGAWALWTRSAQRVFSRADFVGYHAACGGGRVALEVTGVRMTGPRTAVIRMGAKSYRATYAPRYELGHWRWQPTDDDLAFYRQGLAGVIAKAKAEGSCG